MNDRPHYPWKTGDALFAEELNAAIANSVALAGGMLPLNGSTPMTGPLTLAGNATLPLHAVPLQQLTSTVAGAVAGAPFLPLSGGNLSGALTVSYAFSVNGDPATNHRGVWLQSNSVNRWGMFIQGAEPGSDAGSSLIFGAYSDAGAYLNSWMQISRTDGAVNFLGPMNAFGHITSGSNTVTGLIDIEGPAASQRTLQLSTNYLPRWQLRCSNTAEGGSNAGSNFEIAAYSDAGAQTSVPISITRSSGSVAFSGGATFSQTLTMAGQNQINFNNALTTIKNTGNDASAYYSYNLAVGSTNGIGFASNISGQKVPSGIAAAWINARTGDFSHFGNFVGGMNAASGASSMLQNVWFNRSGTDQLIQCSVLSATASLTSSTPVAGGTGWAVNDRAYDAYNNLYTVTAVSAGAVTTIQMDSTSARLGTAPTNPIALTANSIPVSTGTGLTVNLTWTAPARLVLQHTAGSLLLNGSTGVQITGPITTGTVLTVGDGTTAPVVTLNGVAGNLRRIDFQSTGVIRWRFQVLNNTETGTGNTGSDLALTCYSDAGAGIVAALSITRATGLVNFAVTPTAPTMAAGDNSTSLATTAFAQAAAGVAVRNTAAATAVTHATTDGSLIMAPSATCTLTLLAAATYPGRYLRLKLTTAFAVNSASSNVVPLAGGSATAAILAATAGKYALLQSDGTSWHIMEAN